MNETAVYLVYDDDGARLVYAGEDAEACEQAARELRHAYAGELVSRRRVGHELWNVRAFFRARPDDGFIARRRSGFPFGLHWQPSSPD